MPVCGPFLVSCLQMVTSSEGRHHPDLCGISVLQILLHRITFQTYFKSPFLLVCPSMLFIFLLLCVLNSDLHTKSRFIFIKQSTPKQQNEAVYFHIQVSLNFVFMRKISAFATEKKLRIIFIHIEQQSAILYLYTTFDGWCRNIT